MVAVGFWLPSVAVTIADVMLEEVSVAVVARKPPLLCPDSTVTLVGTLSAGLLLPSETTVFDVAAWFRETVHVDEAFEPMLEGVQLTELSVAAPGVWSVMVAVGLWLPKVAVTTADGVLLEVSVPVVAEKAALLCPDSTVTLVGTLSAGLLLLSETTVFDVADWFRETVHADEAFEPMLEGVQLIELSVAAAGVCSVMVVVGLWLPNVAVTTADAVLPALRVPVVAEKVALVCPDSTVTLEGTVSAALLLLSETAVLDAAA